MGNVQVASQLDALAREMAAYQDVPSTRHRTAHRVATVTDRGRDSLIHPMNPIILSWEDWRAVIGVLREKALPYMLGHADHIERLLEQHATHEARVALSLTDDVFLRSYNWARWQFGIPLPPN